MKIEIARSKKWYEAKLALREPKRTSTMNQCAHHWVLAQVDGQDKPAPSLLCMSMRVCGAGVPRGTRGTSPARVRVQACTGDQSCSLVPRGVRGQAYVRIGLASRTSRRAREASPCMMRRAWSTCAQG